MKLLFTQCIDSKLWFGISIFRISIQFHREAEANKRITVKTFINGIDRNSTQQLFGRTEKRIV